MWPDGAVQVVIRKDSWGACVSTEQCAGPTLVFGTYRRLCAIDTANSSTGWARYERHFALWAEENGYDLHLATNR